jgi:hypothetical protein
VLKFSKLVFGDKPTINDGLFYPSSSTLQDYLPVTSNCTWD